MSAVDRPSARRALRALRAGLDSARRAAADAAIGEGVDRLVLRAPPAAIAVYWPIGAEPDLRERMALWHAGGIAVALPRVATRDAPLAFDRWVPGCELEQGEHGTMHPSRADALLPELIVIPCLGFDARGHRLGYGGGYYDRTLAARTAATIGVAYDCLEVRGFDAQPHDRVLDWIVTESRVLAGIHPRD